MLSSSSCAHITSSFLIIILGSEWIDRVYTFFLFTSAKNRKRKHMSQLVQLRLYSRAQYALCGCQHSQALTQSKGVSFVSLWGGRQVDYFVSLGMLLAKLFLKCFLTTFVHLLPKPLQASPAFWGRSHSWGTSFPHFVCSIQCHALSKEGPTSWIDAAYWICSFATWRRTLAHFHGVICVWRLYSGTACWNPIIPWRFAFPLPLVVGWPPCTKCVFGPQVVKKIGVAPPRLRREVMSFGICVFQQSFCREPCVSDRWGGEAFCRVTWL